MIIRFGMQLGHFKNGVWEGAQLECIAYPLSMYE